MPQDKLENLLNQLLLRALELKLILRPEDLQFLKPPFLEPPKEKNFGDISCSAPLKLAHLLGRKPRDIACDLAAYLNEEIGTCGLKKDIEKIDVAGAGFINFYLSPGYFYSFLKDLISGREVFRPENRDGRKTLVEFVSANPTGPLSVAHGRQAAVGDALCNILEFLGCDVSREYYLNDEGNQINILGKSIYLRLRELNGEKIDFPQDHYQGEYIIELAKELLQPPARGHQSPEGCRGHGVKRILEIIRKELDDFGVRFDSWYSQASLESSGKIKEAIAFLKEKGFVYEQEGATWFASTGFGDDKDRVIVKSDGSYTYLAPDIAYHRDKFQRGFERLINLWGPDHHGYIPRLKAAVSAFGRDKDALDVIIVQLATLYKQGKVVSMSTRKGEYVTLRQVMDEVGQDASRFFFLMRKTDSHLDFDLELAKRQSSDNPVYYIQYAHARIANILNNAGVGPEEIREADMSLLKENEELLLLRALDSFGYSLKIAQRQLDPYIVTVYLQELAEGFHRFYDKHRVLVEDVRLRNSRLALITGCKLVISLGLRLLGVSAPDKM